MQILPSRITMCRLGIAWLMALGSVRADPLPSAAVERLCRLGDHVEAESVARQALANHHRHHPASHGCAATLHNLAVVCVARGKTTEAESLYRQALAIDAKNGASADADAAVTLSMLAAIHRDQGRFAEAEPLLVEALAIRENVSGSDHHWTAAVLINLAMTYDAQGRERDAERARARAMRIFQASFATQDAVARQPPEPVPVFRREGK